MGAGDNSSNFYGYDSSQNKDLQSSYQSPEFTGHYGVPSSSPPAGSGPQVGPGANAPVVPPPNYGHQSGPTPDPNNKDAYQKYGGLMEQVRDRIKGMSAEGVKNAADMFYGLWQVLYDASQSIGNASDKLYTGGGQSGKGGWQSPAADAFMSRGPGATLKSMNDWQNATLNNYYALDSISGTITFAQGEIEKAYQTYKTQLASAIHDLRTNSQYSTHVEGVGEYSTEMPGIFDQNGNPNHDIMKNDPGTVQDYMNDVADKAWELSAPGRQIEHDMAQQVQYATDNFLLSGTSTIYEGPQNSVHDPAHPDLPSLPSGVPSGVPSGPSGAPPAFSGAPPTMSNALANGPQQQQQELAALNNQAPNAQQLQQSLPSTAPLNQQLQQQSQNLQAQAGQLAGGVPVVPTALAAGATNLGRVPGVSQPNTALGNRPSLSQGRGPQEAFSKQQVSRPNLSGASEEGLGGRPPASTAITRGGKKLGKVLGRRSPNAPGEGEGETAPRSTTGRPPASSAIRGKQRGTGKPGAPATPGHLTSEELATPSHQQTTSPVLNSRPPGQSGFSESEMGGRLGSTRPGSTPPVLNNKAKRARSEAEQIRPATPGSQASDSAFAPHKPSTAPIVNAPTQYLKNGAPSRFDEVPDQLRGSRPLATGRGTQRLSSRPPTEADLASRRRQAAKKKEAERLEQLFQEYLEMSERMAAGEQPWMVETPGGGVVTSNTEETAVQRPGPALGAS